jgi:Mg/Co/Ni transporter MgtE
VAAARSLVAGMQAPDLADVLELLQPDERVQLVQALGAAFDPEVLPELDETVRDQLSEALPNDLLARAVARLETDDAAYVIEGLEKADQQEILAQIPTGDRARWSATWNTPRRPPAVSCRRTSWRCRRSGWWVGSSTICARRRICLTVSRTST